MKSINLIFRCHYFRNYNISIGYFFLKFHQGITCGVHMKVTHRHTHTQTNDRGMDISPGYLPIFQICLKTSIYILRIASTMENLFEPGTHSARDTYAYSILITRQ